jgi:hypothetical protein
MGLDRDSSFPLQIHRIKQLVLLIPLLDSSRPFQQTVRQGRLSVIDVRDDAEIASSFGLQNHRI